MRVGSKARLERQGRTRGKDSRGAARVRIGSRRAGARESCREDREMQLGTGLKYDLIHLISRLAFGGGRLTKNRCIPPVQIPDNPESVKSKNGFGKHFYVIAAY
jgi:hypothetical protein